MIYILSQTTKKHQKTLSRPLHSKLKKIHGLFKDFPKFQGLFQDCVNPIFFLHQQYFSLRKHPFLLALRRWGRFAWRNVCDSAKEIPY